MERILNNLPARLLLMVSLIVSLALLGCGGDSPSADPPVESGDSQEPADDGNSPATDDTTTENDPADTSADTTEPDEIDPLVQPPINPPTITPAIVEPGQSEPDPIPLGGPVEASTANPYSSNATEETVVGGMSIDNPPPLIAPPIQAED